MRPSRLLAVTFVIALLALAIAIGAAIRANLDEYRPPACDVDADNGCSREPPCAAGMELRGPPHGDRDCYPKRRP